jgi:hypothetical protein
VAGILTAGSFAGGGVLCQSGERHACKPQAWLLVVGLALSLGLGAAGALLWKPKAKRTARFPWEEPR